VINKVILLGNVGRDPEIRQTQSGRTVANFSLATSWRKKNAATGEFSEETEWHRVVAWGRTAEIVEQYAGKGKQLYIEGRLQTRDWEDKDGKKRYTTEIVVEVLKLLGGKGDAGDSGTGRTELPRREGTGGSKAAPVTDDDIPF